MYRNKCVFVMPTYNTYEKYEEGEASRNVSQVLKDLIYAIRKNMIGRQEVIIIDDGSTDETEEELTKLLKRKRFKRSLSMDSKIASYKISKLNLELTVSLLRLSVRQGLNIAVVRGYKEALKRESEYIIKLDSDGEHDPYGFPKLLKHIMKRPRELKLVLMADKDQVSKNGFGFRILSHAALGTIIDHLETFATERKKTGKTWEGKTRGVDGVTKKLIENEFGDDSVARSYF